MDGHLTLALVRTPGVHINFIRAREAATREVRLRTAVGSRHTGGRDRRLPASPPGQPRGTSEGNWIRLGAAATL